jgi:hypothetical protein
MKVIFREKFSLNALCWALIGQDLLATQNFRDIVNAVVDVEKCEKDGINGRHSEIDLECI